VPDKHRRLVGYGAGSAALAVAVITAALAGCGGDGSTSTTAGAGPTSKTAQTSTPESTKTSTEGGGTGGITREKPRRIPYNAVAGTVLTSTKPALVCRRLVTQHYLRTAYGDRQGCVQAQVPGSAAKGVRSRHGGSTGPGSATLTMVPSGGPYDGERVKVSLVLENGAWKVDALHANIPVGP